VLDAIAVHKVGNRPGRMEPRLRKRRTKKYDYMMKPRNETKLDILKQLREKYATFDGQASAPKGIRELQ
jgi:hypothetical protein